MKYLTITAKIVEVMLLSVQMRSRAGTSSMNTIDLFREIMQKDLQECRRVARSVKGIAQSLSGDNSRNRIANT